jgi:isoleucyl-tRNA synthetase
VLEACRAYAQKYVDLQTSQFERIGCFGRWDKPYKTMARDYEARTLEAFYGFLEKGFVYRGLKPVYWCIHDRTALAEAEVEYEMHTSPSVYVRYRLTSDPAAIDPALAGKQVSPSSGPPLPGPCPRRWPWPSIPTSTTWRWLRSAAKPPRRSTSSPPNWPPAVAAACKLGNNHGTGPLQRQQNWSAPPSSIRFLDRSILGVLATYVTADTGTGAVHTAPSHGADDFYTGQRYGLDPTCRVDASGRITWTPRPGTAAAPPAFEGMKSGPPIPSSWPCSKSAARCWPRATWNTPTRTAGAATIRSSSAPPSSGSSA